jgi:hypothetical protein
MNQHLADRGKPSQHQVVRANGGFLGHALPAGTMTSLCGHNPTNTGWKMKRACWMTTPAGYLVTCIACQKKEGTWSSKSSALRSA